MAWNVLCAGCSDACSPDIADLMCRTELTKWFSTNPYCKFTYIKSLPETVIPPFQPRWVMTKSHTRRAVLGVAGSVLSVSIAGCMQNGGDDSGGLVDEGMIGVVLDNQHSQSHELSLTVVDSEGGESYFERTVSLGPNEQSSGSFDDPGQNVGFGVQAELADGQRETAQIEGEQRTGLNLIRAVVLSEGQLAVSWAART